MDNLPCTYPLHLFGYISAKAAAATCWLAAATPKKTLPTMTMFTEFAVQQMIPPIIPKAFPMMKNQRLPMASESGPVASFN